MHHDSLPYSSAWLELKNAWAQALAAGGAVSPPLEEVATQFTQGMLLLTMAQSGANESFATQTRKLKVVLALFGSTVGSAGDSPGSSSPIPDVDAIFARHGLVWILHCAGDP